MAGEKKIVFHIDVNSAYLSWEAVDQLQHGASLDIRTIPAVVGGNPEKRHGIVLAKSIPAKKYQIKTGETLYAARLKCPGLAIFPPRYDLYIRCSEAMLALLREYSPSLQRYSIDEVFLDYTNMEDHFGDPLKAAHQIKDRIHRELGFTVNIGVSNNKLLAKMASDFAKPDQVHTLFPAEVPEKLWPLPVEDLFMVGRATAPKLHRLGIYTIGDLARADPALLKKRLKSHGILIWNYANGKEDSPVGDFPGIKSVGNSSTIAFDVEDRKTAHMFLLSLTEMVAMRLRNAGYLARLVAVSLKSKEFFSYSHQRKLYSATDSTNQIYGTAVSIFDEMWKGEPLRAIGVRAGDLVENSRQQLSLFDPGNLLKQQAIDAAVDKIRNKYGSNMIMRAVFLHSGIKPLTGGVWEEDYPMMSNIL
ncbi:MAG TPA: DNA polymerase IV [Firmicutes bacterium]|nr:DNA polymerase IV [Bacillota bacterium]